MALLEALLALAVMGVVVAGVSVRIEIERTHERAREAGRAVSVLADAARQHVQAEYAAILSGGPSSVTLGVLQASGVLPENFRTGDAMKRDLGVWVVASSGGVRVLAGQEAGVGDSRRPHAALARARPGQRLGIVETDVETPRCRDASVAAPCLLGPGVAEDISAFASLLTLRDGALMELYEYEHRDYCGAFLHRVEDPDGLCPGGNGMAQRLIVTGGIENAARIRNGVLDVHGGLSVGSRPGSATDPADPDETTSLEVTGEATATGRLEADAGGIVHSRTWVKGLGSFTNPVCDPPTSEPAFPGRRAAVCAADRAVMDGHLHVGTVIEVQGRTAPTRENNAVAGAAAARCIAAETLVVEERVRVFGSYTQPGGAGVGTICP